MDPGEAEAELSEKADRRAFEHFFSELSVELGELAPRYPLWLRMNEVGRHADALQREDVIAFCGTYLEGFLADHGLNLSPRGSRRLARSVARFDPSHPSPYDHMVRLVGTP